MPPPLRHPHHLALIMLTYSRRPPPACHLATQRVTLHHRGARLARAGWMKRPHLPPLYLSEPCAAVRLWRHAQTIRRALVILPSKAHLQDVGRLQQLWISVVRLYGGKKKWAVRAKMRIIAAIELRVREIVAAPIQAFVYCGIALWGQLEGVTSIQFAQRLDAPSIVCEPSLCESGDDERRVLIKQRAPIERRIMY